MAEIFREFLPVIIVGAIIGAFTIVFVLAWLALLAVSTVFSILTWCAWLAVFAIFSIFTVLSCGRYLIAF